MKLTRTLYPNLYINPDSGIYYVRRMVRGRPRTLSTGQTTEKMAVRKLHEIMTALDNQKAGWGAKEVPSLGEWWADYRQAKKKSPKTWEREDDIMRLHILPFFGRLRLDEVTQNQIERYLNRRRKEVAEGTVTREQSLLHAVFQAAVDDDLVDKNPLRKISRTRYATRERIVSQDEQSKLQPVLSAMFERWFLFMLGTGIRLGEARGIVPSRDLDLAQKRFRVTGKGHEGIPKERWVPILHPELERILEEQVNENNSPSKRHRSKRFDTLWKQEPVYFRKELRIACKRAGIAYFSPHTLRHTFATRYLQQGGDIFILSQILGHSGVEVTQRVYAHLLTKDHARLSAHVDLGIKRKAKLLVFPQVS